MPRGWADLGRHSHLVRLRRALPARSRPRRSQPREAFANGYHVVDFETRIAHRLYELTFQNFVDQRHLLETAVSWTYWNSEFTVVGLAVLWVYLRRHEAFIASATRSCSRT